MAVNNKEGEEKNPRSDHEKDHGHDDVGFDDHGRDHKAWSSLWALFSFFTGVINVDKLPLFFFAPYHGRDDDFSKISFEKLI